VIRLIWSFISPWARLFGGPLLIGGVAISAFFYTQHLARENERLGLAVEQALDAEAKLRQSLDHLASAAMAERDAARETEDKVKAYESFIASMPDRRCRLTRAERKRLLGIQ
jgi:hypothetical protein